MPDLDDRLAGLARYAERTARLESAPSIRVRADRRRRRRYTAAAALGVALAVALGTGIAIAQPDHPRRAPLPPAGPTSAPPSAGLETPRSTPSFAAQAADEKQTGLKYQRAYRLVPMETGVVGVNPATGLGLAPDGRFQVRWSGATATFIVALQMCGKKKASWKRKQRYCAIALCVVKYSVL